MSRSLTVLYQDQVTPTWLIVLLLVLLAAKLFFTAKTNWKDRIWESALLVLLLLVLNVRYVIGPGLLAFRSFAQ